MLRNILSTSLLFLLLITSAGATDWATQLFRETNTTHEFGTVARGADVTHRFQFVNCFQEDIRIVNIRSSCGCTIPSIETASGSRTIKSGENGNILATLNTRSFVGDRSTTITVAFEFTDSNGHKYSNEEQLYVRSSIRDNLAFDPKAALFNGVSQGVQHERRVTITRYGSTKWQILRIQPHSKHVVADYVEKDRGNNRVSYELVIRLKANSPAGYFREPIWIMTNNSEEKQIVLDVEGRIVSEISASPERFVLGEVTSGQCVTRKISVIGKTPFKIIEIDCPDNRFTFHYAKQAAKMHRVVVTFQGDENLGKVVQAIRIRTDSGVDSLTAFANVFSKSVSVAHGDGDSSQYASREEHVLIDTPVQP